MKTALCVVTLIALMVAPAFAGSSTDEVKKVWAHFVELEKKHDPAFVELYAHDASIQRTRRKPDGTSQTTKIPAGNYKEMIREAMPMAQELKEQNTYSDVKFKEIDDKVQVTATRRSAPKGPPTEMTVTFAKRDDKWLIVEESSVR